MAIRQLEDPDEDPYEWFDQMLNSVCGEYVKWNGLLPSAVRQGSMGLPGLCDMLQYFIDNGFASEEMLEIHINNLIEEAQKVYVTINLLRERLDC